MIPLHASFPCKPLEIIYNSCVRVFPSDRRIGYVSVTSKAIGKTYIMTGKFLFFSVLCKSELKLRKEYIVKKLDNVLCSARNASVIGI